MSNSAFDVDTPGDEGKEDLTAKAGLIVLKAQTALAMIPDVEINKGARNELLKVIELAENFKQITLQEVMRSRIPDE